LLAGLAGAALVSGDAVAAQCGRAAWYDLGGKTASGERSDGSAMAAAHRTLPFGTRVRVENLSNGREVIVRINDRGPFVGGRVIDVTRAAAEELGMIKSGTANVRVSVVDGKAELDSCKDPSPRTITADAVANGSAGSKPAPEPSEPETAATSDAAAEPGTVAATPSPNESKPAGGASGKVLVASVQYDDGAGESRPARAAAGGSAAASFTEEAQVDELDDAKIVAADVDIPLPRPRPPIFGEAAPAFNRTLAMRFVDAFAPGDPAMELTLPLGYAPVENVPVVPRGAIITE
jgi:rare lipoprotein A